MSAFALDEQPAGRPLWLITLLDLCFVLLGFFVLLQSSQLDRGALVAGFRAGFGIDGGPAPAPMPVGIARVSGFAAGSSDLPDEVDAALEWARDMARDPRVTITVTGHADGGEDDVDPFTGSGAILAADRARAVAALLVGSGAVAPGRMSLATAEGGRRQVALSLGFAGERRPARDLLNNGQEAPRSR